MSCPSGVNPAVAECLAAWAANHVSSWLGHPKIIPIAAGRPNQLFATGILRVYKVLVWAARLLGAGVYGFWGLGCGWGPDSRLGWPLLLRTQVRNPLPLLRIAGFTRLPHPALHGRMGGSFEDTAAIGKPLKAVSGMCSGGMDLVLLIQGVLRLQAYLSIYIYIIHLKCI